MTRNRGLLIGVLGWFILACNLSGVTATEAVVSLPTTSEKTPIRVTVAPSYTPTVADPTPTFPPADVTFSIDCSEIPDRQKDCEDFIARTRDLEYPILREVTGVSLSDCYKDIHYVILPRDPGEHAGGLSSGDTITYNAKYSIDLDPRADVHELLHSITSCTRAMDDHVFHYLILNYVYDRQDVQKAGYFTSQENLLEGVDFLTKALEGATGADLANNCRGMLQRKVGLAFFISKDGQKILDLYRSTIDPKTEEQPNALLKTIWKGNAAQVQAIVESLRRDFDYSMDVPACGL